MQDRTTPPLAPDEQQAITFASLSTCLSGSEFLTGREAQLQARLDELDREMASLDDRPGEAEALEQQALDGLRALLEVLEPPAEPAPLAQPEPGPPAPVLRPNGRRRFWRIVEVAAALLAVTLSAFILVRLYGLRSPGEAPPATAAVSQSTASVAVSALTSAPAATATARPTQPPATSTPRATATPLPAPTVSAPVVADVPARDGPRVQAEMLQVMDISGTLGLELPLTAMTETVQLVDGLPVLQPVLPEAGGGLHRGSAPFGQSGTTIIVLPAGTAPDSLRRIRPGDRLVGCNTDGKCHDYRVAAAEMWPLDHLGRLLTAWPVDEGVLLYTVADEATAWVVQAEPLREEETR